MKKIVKIVSEDEYKAWVEKQQSFYESQVKGTSNDPYPQPVDTTVPADSTAVPALENTDAQNNQ